MHAYSQGALIAGAYNRSLFSLHLTDFNRDLANTMHINRLCYIRRAYKWSGR